MGDASDMVESGILCVSCSEFIYGESSDFPGQCHDCAEAEKERRKRPNRKRVRMTRPTSDGKPREDERKD